MKCLWCNNTSLRTIYDVKTSKIGASVQHCDRCNLVQSLYSSRVHHGNMCACHHYL